eukprot:CFRG7626T1
MARLLIGRATPYAHTLSRCMSARAPTALSVSISRTYVTDDQQTTSPLRSNVQSPQQTVGQPKQERQSRLDGDRPSLLSWKDSAPAASRLWELPGEKTVVGQENVTPDSRKSLTQDEIINKFTCLLMRDGKKAVAQSILYKVMEKIKSTEIPDEKKEGQMKRLDNPMGVIVQAVENSKPLMECRNLRAKGSVHLVPTSIKEPRRYSLAMRWIVDAARKKKKPYKMEERLYLEIMDCYKFNQEGAVMKKRAEVHKTAEANRAFASFRW